MNCDAGAMYVAVDLWSLAPWSQHPATLRRMLKKTCILTTAALFPELNPNSGNRFPARLALAVFGVPARKPSGVYHSHLFLRVPPAASSPDLRRVAIQELGRRTIVRAPVAVASFVNTFRRLNGMAASSVHLVHDHANDPCVIDLAVDTNGADNGSSTCSTKDQNCANGATPSWSHSGPGGGLSGVRIWIPDNRRNLLPALRYATASPSS
jgi:hypothetical protein